MTILLFICLLPFMGMTIAVACLAYLEKKKPGAYKLIDDNETAQLIFAITMLAISALATYGIVSLIS